MKEIIEIAKKSGLKCYENEPMKNHTSFKIGGNAKLVVEPKTKQDIADIIKKCNELNIRFLAIGKGSNLLVDDNGIDACVILLDKEFSDVELIGDDVIYAQSGASLMKVCRFALENELTGLEFAYGIPGSCGGAAFMNAGAYGGEMKDVLYKCEHIDQNGCEGFLENDELDLSYRHSVYYNNNYVITGLYLKMKKGSRDEIKSKMDDLLQRRKDKQPLEYPSAGSTFKRPTGYFAGALIEECGLKGACVGDAMVSVKHAGFVINKGNAKCKDVLDLCKLVSDKVMQEKGVKLEMEIRVTK